jgi:putative ABC transport system substrate-binding protein
MPETDRPQSQTIKGFKDGLKELRLEERKNIVIDIVNAKGDRSALQPAALDLIARRVDVLVVYGTSAARIAQAATRDIPIVFILPGDPVAVGLAKSIGESPTKVFIQPSAPVAVGLAKSMSGSTANSTGVAGLSMQLTDKRLSLLKEIVPGVQRVLIFYDANNQNSREHAELVDTAARRLDLQVGLNGIKAADELRATFGALQQRNHDALFHVPDDLVEGEAAYIIQAARQKKLPTMFSEEVWALSGALAAYGPSYLEMGRQAARLVDKILKGQKPGSLPIERAAKFDLTLNYRTANFIGLHLAPEILKKADRVIR